MKQSTIHMLKALAQLTIQAYNNKMFGLCEQQEVILLVTRLFLVLLTHYVVISAHSLCYPFILRNVSVEQIQARELPCPALLCSA